MVQTLQLPSTLNYYNLFKFAYIDLPWLFIKVKVKIRDISPANISKIVTDWGQRYYSRQIGITLCGVCSFENRMFIFDLDPF